MTEQKLTRILGIPLKDEEVARIDALRPRFSTPGRRATREDVLKVVLRLGLELAEAAQPPSPQRPMVH